jgi:thiamine biosynthesis lipoprotein
MTRPRLHALRHCERAMSTVTTFDVYTEEGSIGRELRICIAKACALLHRFDGIFSLWKPTSPMSQSRTGKLQMDEVPPVIAEVMELCDHARI